MDKPLQSLAVNAGNHRCVISVPQHQAEPDVVKM